MCVVVEEVGSEGDVDDDLDCYKGDGQDLSEYSYRDRRMAY